MSYTLSIAVVLGIGQTGLTLSAQLVDTSGANVGSAVSTGFVEIGQGNYLWTYASFPDDFRGGVTFSSSGMVKAFYAVNPEEAEYTNSKLSTIATNVSTVSTNVTAVKAKTDNLPASPAAVGDAMTLTSGERTTLAGVIWATLTSTLTTSGSIGKRMVDFLTGDIYARIGAPAGASVSADIAAVLSAVDGVSDDVGLVKTDTETLIAGVALVKAKTDNLPAQPAATGDAMTLTGGERNAVANALLDLGDAVELGLSVRSALRLALAALVGVLTGGGTTTITIKNAVANDKTRITATVDENGNRTEVTVDVS